MPTRTNRTPSDERQRIELAATIAAGVLSGLAHPRTAPFVRHGENDVSWVARTSVQVADAIIADVRGVAGATED